MSEHEKDSTMEKSNMEQPQEEFIDDQARPSLDKKDLAQRQQPEQ